MRGSGGGGSARWDRSMVSAEGPRGRGEGGPMGGSRGWGPAAEALTAKGCLLAQSFAQLHKVMSAVVFARRNIISRSIFNTLNDKKPLFCILK